ncbi:DUF3168 domain-containing protein [Cupriavidus sp. BIC8F]|uniref:DUF3168 domain-containing protein n=1 Tax=Cupriavidus sp. BIC8F TaxID=3079014 RepID=UPI0029162022|nr:DUF3168 domain-containing protein [Cupriavidus sp. BIC8F]
MANLIENIVFGALKSLVDNGDGTYRCYPDVAPANAVRPYLTYQSVGGQSLNILDGNEDLQNARVQVNAWANDRLTASTLIQSAIAALTSPTIKGISIGAPVSTFEMDTRMYGSRQDFSIWYYP